MTKRTIIVGGTLNDAARRVADTWHRAQRGEPVEPAEPEENVTFATWSGLASIMTDRRHEILRHLHQRPEPSLRSLARALGRDYKRVHQDVAALEAVGLIDRDAGGLRADYAEIRTVIAL